jgi:hypothetical protein
VSDRIFWGLLAVLAGVDALMRASDNTRTSWIICGFQALLCLYASRKAALAR